MKDLETEDYHVDKIHKDEYMKVSFLKKWRVYTVVIDDNIKTVSVAILLYSI